jgi:hypothetical protein
VPSQTATIPELSPCTADSPILDKAGARVSLWSKLFSFPVLLGVVLGGSIFGFDSGSIADPDIWWHLRNAEVFVQSHSVVHHDMYSFTAAGSRWINEAWLGELLYYFGWRWFGIRGVYLVMLLEVELILFGVFALAYLSSRNVKAAFFSSWLAVWLATVVFRPANLTGGMDLPGGRVVSPDAVPARQRLDVVTSSPFCTVG